MGTFYYGTVVDYAGDGEARRRLGVDDEETPMMSCPGGGGLMMIPMILSSLIFVAVVIGGLWLLVRAITGRSPRSSVASHSSALTILEERFARGEIDATEFRERRETLES